MTLNKLHLIYHSKDKGMFKSASWRKYYTPDLSIVTRTSINDVPANIIDSFPDANIIRSFCTIGSVYQCRNQFIPTCSDSYAWFLNAIKAAAKRHVLRGFHKKYIPGWDQNCENLYQKYNFNHDNMTANRLLEELNKQCNMKWKQTVESTNFDHSS
jgi:hypothetical protein